MVSKDSALKKEIFFLVRIIGCIENFASEIGKE